MQYHECNTTTPRRGSKADRELAIKLDKYYTRPNIAHECAALFDRFIGSDTIIIEPSAGAGVFLDLSERATFAYDVAPDHPDVIARDFLLHGLAPVFSEIGDVAMIGNPPFGRRSSLAVAFLNRSLDVGHTVGFILPTAFQRWDTQRKVRSDARLLLSHKLPENAFTLTGSPYRLQCVFQVWTRNDNGDDLRLRQAPPASHPDFDIREYCPDSPRSSRHFASTWDFAVRFQGHHDYRLAFSDEDCDRRYHWMMFEATDETALGRLLRIDFAGLSRCRATIPGFARADVVEHYIAIDGAMCEDRRASP